eukprot:GHVU01198862.1.p1 GENE.GHVU01198862.1~~GHVU01198862.1.p1  ORF type:complete len:313 (-),score=36.13 GHVU01198862.1:799-1737(-)
MHKVEEFADRMWIHSSVDVAIGARQKLRNRRRRQQAGDVRMLAQSSDPPLPETHGDDAVCARLTTTSAKARPSAGSGRRRSRRGPSQGAVLTAASARANVPAAASSSRTASALRTSSSSTAPALQPESSSSVAPGRRTDADDEQAVMAAMDGHNTRAAYARAFAQSQRLSPTFDPFADGDADVTDGTTDDEDMAEDVPYDDTLFGKLPATNMTQVRIDAYEESLEGHFPDWLMTLQELRAAYLSMHRVDRMAMEQSTDDVGLKQVRCDCKEWWHGKSCPHIYLMQHVTGDIDIHDLLRPMGAVVPATHDSKE